jgi:hypothetical protein
MLAGDGKGMGLLKDMDLVGVGGAVLSKKAGDELTGMGVRLVSRFGSAECGFLLSSHRDFRGDGECKFLRVPRESRRLLTFENIDDGGDGRKGELVVGKEWSAMAKRNREDRSFATSDMFEKHESTSQPYLPLIFSCSEGRDLKSTRRYGSLRSRELLFTTQTMRARLENYTH